MAEGSAFSEEVLFCGASCEFWGLQEATICCKGIACNKAFVEISFWSGTRGFGT